MHSPENAKHKVSQKAIRATQTLIHALSATFVISASASLATRSTAQMSTHLVSTDNAWAELAAQSSLVQNASPTTAPEDAQFRTNGGLCTTVDAEVEVSVSAGPTTSKTRESAAELTISGLSDAPEMHGGCSCTSGLPLL
jgi:hypothetical protein